MKNGLLAAQSAFEALAAGDFSEQRLRRFEELVESSWIKEELWKVRNFHQGFEHGLAAGILHAGLQFVTGGRGLRNRYRNAAGHTRMRHLKGRPAPAPHYDGKITFGKLEDDFHSGTAHEEDQPVHLHILKPDICHPRCTTEYGNPCRHFCPAAVYEMVNGESAKPKLQINA